MRSFSVRVKYFKVNGIAAYTIIIAIPQCFFRLFSICYSHAAIFKESQLFVYGKWRFCELSSHRFFQKKRRPELVRMLIEQRRIGHCWCKIIMVLRKNQGKCLIFSHTSSSHGVCRKAGVASRCHGEVAGRRATTAIPVHPRSRGRRGPRFIFWGPAPLGFRSFCHTKPLLCRL